MAGFNMDDFLDGTSHTGASQASGGFDMDSFLATPRASGERRGGAEEDEDYGWWERQRDTVLAETGNEAVANSGWAGFAANVVPFVGSQMKKHRDKRLQALEALRTGEGPRDEQPAAQGDGGDEVQGIVADALSGIDPALLAKDEPSDVASGRKGWDALRRFAVDEAELDEKAVDALYGAAKTPEDFANSLRGLAEGEIKNIVKRRKDAAARLNANKADWIGSVVNGLVTNAGYTGQYIAASAVPFGLGYAGLVGDAAHQRYLELTTKDYDIDPDGRLVVIHNEDKGGAGTAAKAVLGGAAEVAVEQSLEKLLGAAGRGLVKIPGVGKAAGAVGKAVTSTTGKAANATARALSKNPAGKWLVGAARGFGKYSEITGVHGMPMEMLEEHVQAFADDVLGLGKKDREQKGLADEASDWWHNKFWNAENNKEIFLGLVGTMAVQGAYAGTAAHAEAKKRRRNPAGYLKTMIDEKTVDALSDEEVAHLYRFVTSDGFTEKNVNRFLGHVKQRVDLSNALLQLRDAAAPFFGKNDQKAVDEAIAAGKIRSKFVPPTRGAAQDGDPQLDWQPYTMKDGRRALRLYDPNTGIAIDAIGGDTQNVVVVNRDGGARIVAGDLNAALHVADTMSVNNQLLDMKRPMKEAYVRSRIQAVFPGGNFVLMKNAAELNKTFPELAKDRDYDPTNPAFTKNGKVYLVLDNMRNAYEVNRMILHEAAIHAGLNKKFSAAEKRKFLRSVGEGALEARYVKNLLARRGAKGIDELSDADVEELFAHTWDRRRTDPSLWQKASHALRDMGRSLHLPLDYNADDLEVMVDSLQRDGKGGEGSVAGSDFDTEDHAQGVPYGMGVRDYSGDVADASAPAERSEGGEAARGMQRNDRIRRNHPYTWMYAIRKFDGDEDAAADFVSDLAAKEAQLGVAGETERGMHAVIIGQRLENGEDLLPEDMDILEENGFTGQVLYRDFGYRRQKNGVWKLTAKPEAGATAQKPVQATSAPKAAIATETTTTEGGADETGNGADEAPAKPEEGAAGEPEAAEVAKPAEAEPPRAEAPDAGVVEPSAEGAEKPVSERSIVEKLTDRAPVQELPVAEVVNDDRRIPNFKEGANPETGEVEPLTGEPYDLVSNPIVVMEFKDGKKVVVTGRHRLAMYKRAGREKIAARVIREADGWTVEDAKAIDAIGNIIDEKGSVKDYVNYFSNAKPTRDEAKADGFLDRPKGQRAFSIYEGASEDTRAAIDWDGTGGEGLISVEQAGAIAEAAPKQAALQRILVRRALDGVRGKKLAILARSLADEAKRRGAAPKADGGTQLDLFTSEEDMALLRLEERRADYRAKRANEYNRIAENLRTALRKGGRLDLNRGYARELGITDPKDKGQVAAARDKAVERANYWENAVRLDEADKAAMDEALGLAPAKEAKPDLTLESATPEQIKAEEEAQRRRAEIKRRQEAPLKGGTGEVGQTQMDLGDTNGDLFNPVVLNEAPSRKPLTGARGAAAKVFPQGASEAQIDRFVESQFIPLSDVASSSLDKNGVLTIVGKSKDGFHKEQRIFRDGSVQGGVVADEANPAKPAPDAAAMERARKAAERHVVSYGNGMKGTLADIIRSGGGRLHPEKGLTTFDKGKPRVVTVGFEQFAPTKDELPHLVQVQREYDAAHPDEVPPSQRGNIRSNGLMAVVSSTDEDVMESMRNQVRKESTKDLEHHLATPGYRSEYKQAAREELARRKAEEDAAKPASHAPTPDGSSKGGNGEVKGGSADSDTMQDLKLGQEVIDAASDLEWGLDNGHDARPRKAMLKDAIAKANAHDLGILVKAAESEMSRRFKWKKNYEGKPIEPTHIYVWRMVKEEAQRRLSAMSTKPAAAPKLAGDAEAFGGDREAEKAFTDALDAMWFSRAVEENGIIEAIPANPSPEDLARARKDALDGKLRIGRYKPEDLRRFVAEGGHSAERTLDAAIAAERAGARDSESRALQQSAISRVLKESSLGWEKDVQSALIGRFGKPIRDEYSGELIRGKDVIAVWHVGDSAYKLQRIYDDYRNGRGFANDLEKNILLNARFGKRYGGEIVGGGTVDGAPCVVVKQPWTDGGTTDRRIVKTAIDRMLRETGLERAPDEYGNVNEHALSFDLRDDRFLYRDFNINQNYFVAEDGGVRILDADVEPRTDVRWFSREVEGRSDEEREAHNLLMGVKAIRAFAKGGGRAFGDFAATVRAYRPEVYERIRQFMPGMWLNARLGGMKDLQERSEAQYQAVLQTVDQGYTYDRAKGVMVKPEGAPGSAASAPSGAEKPTEAPAPKQKTRGEAISAAADEIIDLIRVDATQRKLTRKDLEDVVAKHLGGSVAEGAFEMKDVTDIMELAVNRIMKGSAAATPLPEERAENAVGAIEHIRRILGRVPTQTTRSAEQDKMQQFSTPPHEAYAAVWVANVTDGDVMLEPSAGIGGIAVFAKNAGAKVILNELSPRRREILAQLGLSDRVYDFNAEHLWAHFYPLVMGKGATVPRPTVVVMNPPFSNSALTSRKDTVGVGGKHIEEALDMLAPGGRLVAIVGHGMAHDAESPKVRAWWRKIGEKYSVRADVTVNGEEYAKYGTTYDNDIIVIDKVAPKAGAAAPVYGIINSIDELPAMLEGVRNDRPAIQSDSSQPSGKGANQGGGGRVGELAQGGAERLGSTHDERGEPGVRPHLAKGLSDARDSQRDSGRAGDRSAGRNGGAKRGYVGGGVRNDADRRDSDGRGGRDESPNIHISGVEKVSLASGVGGKTAKEVGDGTFSTYSPAKVHIEGAKPHPTPLVESTAMASVQPPDPTYSPILPRKAIENGRPSAAQLEQIVYAGQAHEQKLPDGRRKGYFFGDGTGLGKGTEIGGVISDNWNHGRRKAVWVSKESGLLPDAMRDLAPYGLDSHIFGFDPRKKSVSGRTEGIAFISYDSLRQDCVFDTDGNVHSAKQGKKNNFQRLVEWLGKDFDGVIVFDEAHKAGNAVATRGKRGPRPASKRGLAVVALQDALPNARVLYVSATGATEVSNLSFATRLGLWGKGTAFHDRASFINQVSSGGLSVMEIVARDMKALGVYMARSLSYDGIVNRKLEHRLSPDQKRKYDEMADAWQMVISRVGDALVATNGAANGEAVKNAMSALWGGQQRFFSQLLTAMQMPGIIADAKKQLAAGNSVVFQIVNTNEAQQNRSIEAQRQRDGEVNAEDLDLSPRDIIIGFVQHSFPTYQYVETEDADGNRSYDLMRDANGNPVESPIALEAKQELLDKLSMMSLDENPLELILDEFGADNVAEVTGRSRRRQPVRNEDGEVEMKLVRRSKKNGLVETDEFNAGKRRVLVFSDAGGTGRSFHADKTFGNQQKRIHYLVQAGWRADTALQGLGRTHRSNEAQPPEYVLCSTDVRGHQRFIATIARRLAQLGSLTAGDRSSAGAGVFSEEDNLENRYATTALHDLMESIYREDRGRFTEIARQLGFVKPRVDRRTGEVEYVNTLIDRNNELDLSKLDIPTFLNRILNMRVDDQNALFDEFTGAMRDLIELARENGTYDPGLEKLQGHKIEELNRTELWNGGSGTGSTDIVEVGVSKKSRKMPFDTARSRMERQAEGRDWTFARNVRSGKVFGVVSLARTKTDASGVVHDQIRCFFPDGTTATLNADDVRFTGERQNFVRLSEKEAADAWQKAYDAVPELNTAKRYFVTGTLLPVWDRLGVQNPRIYRITPTGGGASFLGMEVKAESVNDVLRRFGKAAQSVELTPEAVLNRVVAEGKKVPLLQTGWELKRARVNGDWRVELTGPEDRKTLEKLAAEGLGTYERIGYTPRFFVPRTAEGIKTFLDAYPAMPEDGGIASAVQSGEDYSSLDYAGRQRKFAELFEKFRRATVAHAMGDSAASQVSEAEAALDGIISAMQVQELVQILRDFRQYDTRPESAERKMRQMVAREVANRHYGIDQEDLGLLENGGRTMWFSRDIEGDDGWDPLSAIAIHEVNAWRAARGLPEMPKSPRTSVESIVKAGKYMASNEDEMRRFIEVSARTPQNWTAVEVNAVAQRRLALERDYDEKTRLIEVAEMNGNREEARRIREARDEVERFIGVMDSAINKAKREWGLSGLARRFMLNRDGTFARFTGELRSVVGRALTEDEERGARALWDAYRAAQGTLDEATVAKTAELLKDIVKEHMRCEEQAHRQGGSPALAEVERDYQHALDHIRVHANRAGGVLIGLPNGRRWIDAIRRFHMAAALETGRGLTVDEMLAKIHEDIDGMVRADDHDIMQIITGHGNTYEADNSELEKALREQRRLMNEYQKWEDMMDEGHLPDKTGLIRDEPTQTEREAQRRTREMMREFMQEHPELMQMDASRRLKTMQDTLMKRWKNEIEDLRKAIDEGERIMRQKNTMTYTPEMEEMRRELEQMRQQYREAFPPEPLTHEQRVARVTRVLQARLAKLEEKRAALENAGTDAERAAVLAKAKGEKVEDAALDALRERIDEVKEDIEDLKTMAFPEGTPEEFTAMLARRRKALERNVERIQTLLANRDFAPQKREPSALAKRVAADPEIVALTKARNAATKKLMQERERMRRSTLPYNAGRALDWFETLTAVPRVFRTMLDLSATMTQGAALFAAHPVLGYRALADSVRAFYSEENSDAIMAAMLADPDFEEFQRMGGHIYTVSDIGERGVPEEFRGVATKLVTVNGREYGLEDVPGVKASERSFGTFLNSINLSVYKAIKASGGWGPTGPSEAQKRDIALSLNVASGRGYENKGARGAWERLASAALWAPRFAVSGFKMATGWNVLAPHFTGLTTERSYGDRWVSSKVAAREYARQLAAMAAWTLVATLLMGRKDPEWLDEVTDPRSSNFLNVRVGNTNLNFFGPIKQWWTFMARILTGKTRGADGVVRRRDQGQTAARFARGKLSPLFGLGVDLVKQKDFLGNKLVWEGEPDKKNREKGGYSHVAVSLGVPLSAGDVFEAFRENSLANALMLTPFIVAGAAKSTYELDEYARTVAPYNAAAKEYAAALKEGRREDARRLREENPALRDYARIEALKKAAANTKRYIGAMEKEGKRPSKDTLALYERQQQAVFDAITAAKKGR